MGRNKKRYCCLCGELLAPFEMNNPAPLASSDLDCCDWCNATKVLPARIIAIYGLDKSDDEED